LNIGAAAKAAGVSAKMIRHYETIGLIPAAARRESGYRDYSADDIHRLRFIRRGRKLGFAIEQIRELLRLWNDRERSNADVRKVALDHVAQLEAKAAELQEMIATLRHLADACRKGDRPMCPIIQALSGGMPSAPATSTAIRRTRRSSPYLKPDTS
jgi:MerR family transcriptional regulator, copper efflux regulator